MMKPLIRLISLLSVCSALAVTPIPPGTAFTFQGQLNDGANAANGSYDLVFSLYASSVGGVPVSTPITNNASGITNGLFTVTLDFGSRFSGEDRWLEIAVRTNGHGGFIPLAPRQALTPTPYAIFAGNASSAAFAGSAVSLSGTLPTAQLAGKILNSSLPTNASFAGTVTAANGFVGDGAKITNVDATTLNGLTSGSFWKSGGNAGADPLMGAYLGTSDNLPLEFRVNGQRAFRIEDASLSPNLIGGFSGNTVSRGVFGSVIVGGGTPTNPNRAVASMATVLGGEGNRATGTYSLAMGVGTIASGNSSVALGQFSAARGQSSLAVGDSVTATGASSVALGTHTTALGSGAVALGNLSEANHDYAFVWSDGTAGTPFTSTANNQFLVHASGGVGIGTAQPNAGLHVYSDNNPTVVRIQSSGAPGFGRVEFVSNPQGDAREWRPGYIQSTDNGGFTGGLAFYVNGSGSSSRFGSLEVMRLVNGNVGIGTATPASSLHVLSTGPDCEISIQSPDQFDPAGAENSPPRPGHRWTLQSSSPIAQGHLAASFQIIDRTLGVSRMLIDAGGNVGIGTTSPSKTLEVAGDILASGTVTGSSDRNVKEHFSTVDPAEVLDKVTSLPISAWNYKADVGNTRHIGPMAQDFYAAFGVGQDDRHISMVDADGVALAAIQGLNRKLEEQKKERASEIETLKKRNSSLEQRLAELEARLNALAGSSAKP